MHRKMMKQWFKKEFGRDCYHTPIGIDQKVFNPDVKLQIINKAPSSDRGA